jgi:two-component system response regulator PilR (NtrC family)
MNEYRIKAVDQEWGLWRDPVIGQSEAIQRAKREVERAQGLRILFVGETGVGKTPFARYSNAIMAGNHPRPFEQVNCACLSPEHFQDQLFGHRKGAFSGAVGDKRGLVDIARGGDLFLDEIGDMPLSTQSHFLTFLDTMEYYPLGDDKKRHAEVRVLCATNRDLRRLVEEGTFRQDLFSRISQVTVEIAPLRERTEDIRPLMESFILQFVGENKPYDEAIVSLFEKNGWREGNVRELKDAVECLCLLSRHEPRLEARFLGDRYRGEVMEVQCAEPTFSVEQDLWMLSRFGLENYLEKVEKACLERLLKKNEGSLESMARQLGMSRPTLYRRLKKYSIATPRACLA